MAHVIIAPHPDDEWIGCGCEILKSLDEKIEIKVLVITEIKNSAPRIKVSKKLAKKYGYKIYFLGEKEKNIRVKKLTSFLHKHVREEDSVRIPDIDSHPDHQLVAKTCKEVLSNKMLQYCVYNNSTSLPRRGVHKLAEFIHKKGYPSFKHGKSDFLLTYKLQEKNRNIALFNEFPRGPDTYRHVGDYNVKAFENSVSVYDNDILNEQEKDIIKKYFRKKKVLDLGCGCGRTTINLHKLGYSVIGIDYAEALIECAKKKFPKIKFMHMDAKKLRFPDTSFDTVFFSYNGIDYLHPLKDRKKAIREASRVLKKDGVFIFSTHKKYYFRFPLKTSYPFVNIHYLRTMVSSVITKNDYRMETHQFGKLKTYCKNDCSTLIRKNGFRKVKKINAGYTNYYICHK